MRSIAVVGRPGAAGRSSTGSLSSRLTVAADHRRHAQVPVAPVEAGLPVDRVQPEGVHAHVGERCHVALEVRARLAARLEGVHGGGGMVAGEVDAGGAAVGADVEHDADVVDEGQEGIRPPLEDRRVGPPRGDRVGALELDGLPVVATHGESHAHLGPSRPHLTRGHRSRPGTGRGWATRAPTAHRRARSAC